MFNFFRFATAIALLSSPLAARADTFGSGTNQFDIDFVAVGQTGNAADTNGYGAVGYEYRLGLHEVSTRMANAASTLGSLGLSPSVRPDALPATGMTWNQAARFVNWLNTNSGYVAAYKFAVQPGEPGYDPDANIELWATNDPGYNASNAYRNARAKYFLPGESEWYKGAFFNPAATNYFTYPTASGAAPTPVPSGTNADTAVFAQISFNGPAAITSAGGPGPYGTMAQGGNVQEYLETAFVGANTNAASARALRGGSWTSLVAVLESSSRGEAPPNAPLDNTGFRVASAGTNSAVILTVQTTPDLAAPWQPVVLTPSMVTPEGRLDLGAVPGNAAFYRLQIEVVQP